MRPSGLSTTPKGQTPGGNRGRHLPDSRSTMARALAIDRQTKAVRPSRRQRNAARIDGLCAQQNRRRPLPSALGSAAGLQQAGDGSTSQRRPRRRGSRPDRASSRLRPRCGACSNGSEVPDHPPLDGVEHHQAIDVLDEDGFPIGAKWRYPRGDRPAARFDRRGGSVARSAR